MVKNYIGLSCTGHDNAMAIVNEHGEVVFAEATERYLQNKRAVNTPPDDAFRTDKLIAEYCHADAELVIAKTWGDGVYETLAHEKAFAQQKLNEYAASLDAWKAQFHVYSYLADFVRQNVAAAGNHLKFYCEGHPTLSYSERHYDHHLTHAASGLYSSPFEHAMCLVIDGAGEGTAVHAYRYKDGVITALDPEHPIGAGLASLGFFYGLVVCGLCGFSGWEGEEWKVMGLAPYGEVNDDLLSIMRDYIRVEGLTIYHPEEAEAAYSRLLQYARKPGASAESVANVARTGQAYFAELTNHLLATLHQMGDSDNLVLAGGCALNSAYAGTIIESTPFKHVHIFSAPADDGNAVGAALLAYYEDNPDKKPKHGFFSPYLGSTMKQEILDYVLQFSGLKGIKVYDDLTQLYADTASLIAEGNIIGWIQGRAEFGPRALGNRSILADPRNPDMKDKINGRIKFREQFRPFAPSILHEFGDEYFENYQITPYMERTLRFRDNVKERIPAVVHANQTGRLQSVKKEWNAAYYSLIKAFYDITGVPILVNTSLNVMGKPIVHSVEDAIALFYTCGLDVLVINNVMIRKNS